MSGNVNGATNRFLGISAFVKLVEETVFESFENPHSLTHDVTEVEARRASDQEMQKLARAYSPSTLAHAVLVMYQPLHAAFQGSVQISMRKPEES